MGSRGRPRTRRRFLRVAIATLVSLLVLYWWASQHGGTRQPKKVLVDQAVLVVVESDEDGTSQTRSIGTFIGLNDPAMQNRFDEVLREGNVEVAAIVHVRVIEWLGWVPRGVPGFGHVSAHWHVFFAQTPDEEVEWDVSRLDEAQLAGRPSDWKFSLGGFLLDELAPSTEFEHQTAVTPSLTLGDHGVSGSADLSSTPWQLLYFGVCIACGVLVGLFAAILIVPPERSISPPPAPQ